MDLVESVDWKVGDTLVLTATDYSPERSRSTDTGSYSGNAFAVHKGVRDYSTHAESLTVVGLDNNGTTVVFRPALKHVHFSGDVDVGFSPRAVLFE